MKKLLVLGAGTGGALVANILSRRLPSKEWRITVVDKAAEHHYQPGYLFIPFRLYGYEGRDSVARPIRRPLGRALEFVSAEVRLIDHAKRRVETDAGAFEYDWLVLAMGCRTAPEETEGLVEALGRNAGGFYRLDDAVAMQGALEGFRGGRLVVNVADMPVKCPVAPIEFAFLADYFFRKKGVRERVSIEYATPLDGAFTKPVANRVLGALMRERGITVTPNFLLSSVDAGARTIESFTGGKIEYDLLCSVPVNLGPRAVGDSGLGDAACYALTDDHNLKSRKAERVYAIGDATNLHTSKAGSVTHFEAEIAAENILLEIAGKEPRPLFDGHSNCFIETGGHRALLFDFNYDVEPVHGTFPIPGIGPLSLMENTLTNHLGKLAFRWVYWNLLLPGTLARFPVFPNRMSMRGKNLSETKIHKD